MEVICQGEMLKISAVRKQPGSGLKKTRKPCNGSTINVYEVLISLICGNDVRDVALVLDSIIFLQQRSKNIRRSENDLRDRLDS